MTMINTRIAFFTLLFLSSFLCVAQKQLTVKSPDGKIKFTLTEAKNAPQFTVSFQGENLLEKSTLAIDFQSGHFGESLKFKNDVTSKGVEEYDLIVGKNSHVKSTYNELKVRFRETMGLKREIEFQVRVFNDGIGFRYIFPEQKGWESFTILDEETAFNIKGNPTVYCLFWGDYNNSHEALYNTLPFKEIKEDTLMDVPSLFRFSDKAYLSITESNLRDYAGMYLTKKQGILRTTLSPLQGQQEIKVKGKLPHHTPWRTLLIGSRMKTLMESNIITSLNDSLKIQDTSWIKPGKTTFHWWNGDIVPDTTFAPGVNFDFNKYYIDFAAKNKIDYHSVIGYGGFAWYTSDAEGYGVVGPQTDVTKPVPSLDMQKVCDYAHSKGVGIHVWVNWKAIYPDLERAFSKFEEWGINGMMVDFLNRDDQEMVQIQEEILKKAAEHKLFIQFHGSYKPTGLHRTYPNLFTREGTHNYEQNKWSPAPLTAEHDLDIAYVRVLAGMADYHLGGFRAVPLMDFKIQYTRPLMGGTRCHMLAMYVVLESYLNMVADYPSAYEGRPGFDFLQAVPTVWDETVVVNDNLDKYLTIARRNGENWYIGSINNSEEREISIPLDFLPQGNYEATVYSDTASAKTNPNQLTREVKDVNNGTTLKVKMAGGGGHAIIVKKS